MYYTVVPPSEVFKSNKDYILKTMEESEFLLTETYENSLSQLPAPLWLVNGYRSFKKKKMINISREIIKIQSIVARKYNNNFLHM